MDTENYILEAERQLANPLHYRRLEAPIYPSTALKITKILEKLEERKFLDEDQVDYLSPPIDPKPRRYYMLPKIHKSKDKWTIPGKMPPGRPIISDCGSESYPVSEYIDHFLLPASTSHPSYLKDTPHFLDTIQQIQIPEEALLITIDVDGLYTNINNEDGLQAVSDSLAKLPDPSRPTKAILELLKLSLQNNDFIFNGQWYLQTFGVAMGKRFAPAYANIFMAEWEAGALAKCPLQPLVYKRFLDDIFIIWTHGKAEFKLFFEILQNHHESINLKFEIDPKTINFLDTTVFKGPRFQATGYLDTKVFFKETDSLQLLDKESYHPRHTFSGIIKSQILRYKRICNNVEDIDTACSKLFRALGPRGYTPRFLRDIKNSTLYPPEGVEGGASRKCPRENCVTCTHVLPSTEVTPAGPDNSTPIKLQTTQDCRDQNGLYFLFCSDCRLGYVGETGNSFKIRITQHLSDIRNQRPTKVARHFHPDAPHCNLQSLQITFLETLKQNREDTPTIARGKRLDRERFWIRTLRTSDTLFGLNTLPKPLEDLIIPFVVPFSETGRQIAKKAKHALWHLKAKLPKSFPHRFVTAFSRNKNIKDTLVKSQFGPTPRMDLSELEAPSEASDTLVHLAEFADLAASSPRDIYSLNSSQNTISSPHSTTIPAESVEEAGSLPTIRDPSGLGDTLNLPSPTPELSDTDDSDSQWDIQNFKFQTPPSRDHQHT